MDEPSSIIIDTKVAVGNPICSKEQKEKFMKNSLGQDQNENGNDEDDKNSNENDNNSEDGDK